MSIALQNNRRIEIESSGFQDRDSEEGIPHSCSCGSSSSSSSIGKNSDLPSNSEDCEEDEVQSSYKGPLEMMEALEEVLPIRRSISRFYNGKSKSFTSLANASSSCWVKNMTKPENAYSRRRRNLLACAAGGISKRPVRSGRSTLALAAVMSSSEISLYKQNNFI